MTQESHHRNGEGLAGLIMEGLTEDQLIERGLTGDARALDALFARNSRRCIDGAARTRQSGGCRRGPAEGLLSAYRNLPRFERDRNFPPGSRGSLLMRL